MFFDSTFRLIRLSLVAAFLVCGLAIIARPAHAQRRVELTPQAGWLWGGTFEFTNGDVHINAAPEYGVTLGVEVHPGYFAELGYQYQASEMIGRPNGARSLTLFDMSTHYIHASGRQMFPTQGRAQPFVLGGVGMTIYAPGSTNYPGLQVNSQYLLSFSMGGGVQVPMNEKIDLRLQARALIPVSWVSGGIYFGSGGGGVTITGGSAILQGDASLGLTFKLGQ